MTGRLKQNEGEGDGIGLAGLNKIQDIIARTSGIILAEPARSV